MLIVISVLIVSLTILFLIIIRRLLIIKKLNSRQQQTILKHKIKNGEGEESSSHTIIQNSNAVTLDDNVSDIVKIKNIYKKADMLLSSGKLLDAQKLFIQVLSINPEHNKSKIKIGIIYNNLDEHIKAEKILKQATTNNPSVIGHKHLALSLKEQNKYNEAIAILENILNLAKTDHEVYADLAHLYELNANLVIALDYAKKASNLDTKNLDYYMKTVHILDKLKRSKEKENVLRKILNISPYHKEALNILNNNQID